MSRVPTAATAATATRAGVGLVGLAMLGYAATRVLGLSPHTWRSMVEWLVGGVLLHDGVFVPVTLLVTFVGSRLLPAWARPAAAGGLLVLVTVTVAAIPVLGGFSRGKPDLLDRDYSTSWLILLGLVFLGSAAVALRRRSAQSSKE